MRVRDVMRWSVLVLRPELPISEGLASLAACGASEAVVLDGDHRVVGVLTSREALGAFRPCGLSGQVADYMVPTTTVNPDDDVRVAAALLLERGARALPVVVGAEVVGTVSGVALAEAARAARFASPLRAVTGMPAPREAEAGARRVW